MTSERYKGMTDGGRSRKGFVVFLHSVQWP